MDRDEREELLQPWHKERQKHQELRNRLQRLTAREREVLGHLTEGHTVRDIARLSVVSEATVRTQVKSILAKLEVSSQLAAVGIAHAVGWQSPTTEPARFLPDLRHAAPFLRCDGCPYRGDKQRGGDFR